MQVEKGEVPKIESFFGNLGCHRRLLLLFFPLCVGSLHTLTESQGRDSDDRSLDIGKMDVYEAKTCKKWKELEFSEWLNLYSFIHPLQLFCLLYTRPSAQ